jgi:hypothetical protein
MEEWNEQAHCDAEADWLKWAMENRNWDTVQAVVDDFCHEGLATNPNSVGICCCEAEAIVPEEVWKYARLRGQPLTPPLREWPPEVQDKVLIVAGHVLELLRHGQSGC